MSKTSIHYLDFHIKLNIEVEYVSFSEDEQIFRFEIIGANSFCQIYYGNMSSSYSWRWTKMIYVYTHGRGKSTEKELNWIPS